MVKAICDRFSALDVYENGCSAKRVLSSHSRSHANWPGSNACPMPSCARSTSDVLFVILNMPLAVTTFIVPGTASAFASAVTPVVGALNADLAAVCDEVLLLVAGLPVRLR